MRPVAVGETLTANCALEGVTEEIVHLLVALQVGVQVSNAAELLARRIRLWIVKAPERSALLQVNKITLLSERTGWQR